MVPKHLWSWKPDIHRANEGDLVLLGGNSDRSDLVKDQVGWGIAWAKGDGQIVDKQGERHLFCCLSALHHGKPFDVGTHSCVAGASRIVSLITSMELDREIGRIVSVALLVAPLASLSARSLPGMTEWPGIHWMKMEDDMDLMELWIENVRGWDEISASRKDLLSVQKSIEIERWLVLVDVQDSADSMAADSSS